MSELATIRPDAWDLPLFLHVLGALALIGTVALAAVFLFRAWAEGSEAILRLALRSLTLGVLPAWLVMRLSAQWLADKEGYADLDEPPSWINIGFITSEGGLVLILIAILIGWLAVRRVRGGGGAGGSVRVAAVLIALLLALNLFTLWAMTTKPI